MQFEMCLNYDLRMNPSLALTCSACNPPLVRICKACVESISIFLMIFFHFTTTFPCLCGPQSLANKVFKLINVF